MVLRRLAAGVHARWPATGCHGSKGSELEVPSGDPLRVLEAMVARYHTPTAEELGLAEQLPPLYAGAVGYLAYDAVRHVEDLPNRPADDRSLPEMVWQFVGFLAAVDRFRQTIRLVRNVFVGDDPAAQYDAAVAELSRGRCRAGSRRCLSGRSSPDVLGSARGPFEPDPRRVRRPGCRRASSTSEPATPSRSCPRCGSRSTSAVTRSRCIGRCAWSTRRPSSSSFATPGRPSSAPRPS